ncbi:MAG: hypothetical protein R3B09_05050 [Nannocystaceae bacterium]
MLILACGGPFVAEPSTSTSGGDETTLGSTRPIGTTGWGSTSGATTSTTDDASRSSTDEGTTTSGSSSSDTEDGSSSGTTGVEPASCKKLDLLFLIVDGGDLWDTQWALANLMPHLAQRLTDEFADWDYHVMFANPDGEWGNAYCTKMCKQGMGCETELPYPCWYEPDACDLTQSAGITAPAGSGASNVPCKIDGGRRYLTREQHDFAETLACVGRVGGGYGTTKLYPVARATLDALNPALNAPGACNDGFFRDDAYLILFVVSSYPDDLSEGTPEQWTAELKAHKGGKFDKIYFVGLYNGCDTGIPWKLYEPLNEWTQALYHHQNDDACQSTLTPYMDPALDYVLGDCAE